MFVRRAFLLAMAFAAQCFAAAAPRLDLPFYPQKRNGCGAASVAMVMNYWDRRGPAPPHSAVSPEEVYESLYRPGLKGVRLVDMKEFLEHRGLRVFTLRARWEDVDDQLAKGRPLIAALRPGPNKPMHFVVVTGAGPESVWLNDPTRKAPSRMERARFEKQWAWADRWILLAAPSVRR